MNQGHNYSSSNMAIAQQFSIILAECERKLLARFLDHHDRLMKEQTKSTFSKAEKRRMLAEYERQSKLPNNSGRTMMLERKIRRKIRRNAWACPQVSIQ